VSGLRFTSVLRTALALAASLTFVVPAVAHAAPVTLGDAGPFVVLGGSTVTNTGPSVLDGDLGVSPGTALTGFGAPAVVNGATHAGDEVAADAQDALTSAYLVAAGLPPDRNLTGQDLGGLRLTPGVYAYDSSAQLTGQLTLDAEGNSDAHFVFQIGSALTTASASSVRLINGASPCNVYWQITSSAVLGGTTAFSGNIMALTDISLGDAASVQGRLLARNGQVTLINNVLDNSACTRGSTSGGTDPTSGGTSPTAGAATPTSGAATPTSGATTPTSGATTPTSTQGTGLPAGATQGLPGARTSRPVGTATLRRTPRESCSTGFRATVVGRSIARVVFTLDRRRIANRRTSPFGVYVRAAAPGRHTITARVTFSDGTRARSLRFAYRACSAATLRPRRGPSRFTG